MAEQPSAANPAAARLGNAARAEFAAASERGYLLLPPTGRTGRLVEAWHDHCAAAGTPRIVVTAARSYPHVTLDMPGDARLSESQLGAVRAAVDDLARNALPGNERHRHYSPRSVSAYGVPRAAAVELARRMLEIVTGRPAPSAPREPAPSALDAARQLGADAAAGAYAMGSRDAARRILDAVDALPQPRLLELLREMAGVVRLPYVRERIYEHAKSRSGPIPWRGKGIKLLGHSNLRRDAIGGGARNGAPWVRRIFYLDTGSDPYPGGINFPMEAVSLASIFPGRRGTPPASTSAK